MKDIGYIYEMIEKSAGYFAKHMLPAGADY